VADGKGEIDRGIERKVEEIEFYLQPVKQGSSMFDGVGVECYPNPCHHSRDIIYRFSYLYGAYSYPSPRKSSAMSSSPFLLGWVKSSSTYPFSKGSSSPFGPLKASFTRATGI